MEKAEPIDRLLGDIAKLAELGQRNPERVENDEVFVKISKLYKAMLERALQSEQAPSATEEGKPEKGKPEKQRYIYGNKGRGIPTHFSETTVAEINTVMDNSDALLRWEPSIQIMFGTLYEAHLENRKIGQEEIAMMGKQYGYTNVQSLTGKIGHLRDTLRGQYRIEGNVKEGWQLVPQTK